MTTDEPLVQLNFEETETIVSQFPSIQPTHQVIEHLIDQQVQHHSISSSSSPNRRGVESIDNILKKPFDENYIEQSLQNQTERNQSSTALLSDSIISLSSSTTTDVGFDNCVPDVGFDTINLEGSESRESQPLLGGRDQIDVAYNSFPGT